MSAVSHDRVDAAVRRETDPWIEPVGRIGLAVQGALYIVVGVLALQVASGRQDQADQRGAIDAVANQPFGRLLLLFLTAGLALHCCWRLVLAARGGPGDDDVSMVATPVFGSDGRVVAALTVTGLAPGIDARAISDTGARVRGAAMVATKRAHGRAPS